MTHGVETYGYMCWAESCALLYTTYRHWALAQQTLPLGLPRNPTKGWLDSRQTCQSCADPCTSISLEHPSIHDQWVVQLQWFSHHLHQAKWWGGHPHWWSELEGCLTACEGYSYTLGDTCATCRPHIYYIIYEQNNTTESKTSFLTVWTSIEVINWFPDFKNWLVSFRPAAAIFDNAQKLCWNIDLCEAVALWWFIAQTTKKQKQTKHQKTSTRTPPGAQQTKQQQTHRQSHHLNGGTTHFISSLEKKSWNYRQIVQFCSIFSLSHLPFLIKYGVFQILFFIVCFLFCFHHVDDVGVWEIPFIQLFKNKTIIKSSSCLISKLFSILLVEVVIDVNENLV